MRYPTALIIIMIAMFGAFTGGCDPQEVSQQANHQLTDPASEFQQGVDVADKGVGVATKVVSAIPIPGKAELLVVLGLVSGTLNLIQKLKGNTRDKVLRSVVQAVDSTGDTKTIVKSNLRAAGVESEGRKIIQQFREAD